MNNQEQYLIPNECFHVEISDDVNLYKYNLSNYPTRCSSCGTSLDKNNIHHHLLTVGVNSEYKCLAMIIREVAIYNRIKKSSS